MQRTRSMANLFGLGLGLGLGLYLFPFLGGSACSISNSSTSISDSSSTSSDSSNSSSESSTWTGIGVPQTQYEVDVMDFVQHLVTSGGDRTVFRRSVGGIAGRHGVLDWHREEATWYAIGLGIADAGVSRKRADQLLREWTRSHDPQLRWAKTGFEGARMTWP